MNNATHIPEGDYLTKVQVAAQCGVIHQTVQQWIDKGWIQTIQIPGLGHLIEATQLDNFKPPKPGPKAPRKVD